jgi:putative lipoprotein
MRYRVGWLMPCLVGILLVGCVACGGGETGQTARGQDVVRGTVSYRERMALPPDSIVEVRISDVSLQDAPARVLAETTQATSGQQVPIPFELFYDPAAIDPNRTYAVRATIRSAGRMLFTTDTSHLVITRGNPRQVDLVLVRVTGEAASGPVAFRAPISRSGRLLLRAGQLRFLPCNESGEGVSVQDLPNAEGQALLRELGAGEQGVTVMARLDGNQLQEIRYAGLEGPTCDRLPPEGDLEARGNEPFWFVRVEGTAAVVRTPEDSSGVEYGGGLWSRTSAMAWRYQASRQVAGGQEQLMLELAEQHCSDSMSGARYPFRATLIRGDRRMEGCALEGQRSQAPVQ